jgi:hypothetical protein
MTFINAFVPQSAWKMMNMFAFSDTEDNKGSFEALFVILSL